ncbi:MAG: hypothetical protein FD123_2754 [Bacteroidetes bacterium]|nr:MAG: hypothetical protein FD123_2754 [Bacteroidota bacterium]
MPRHSTLPTLFDECKTVSINDLKKWGYLVRGKNPAGVITWRRRGEITAQISIAVLMATAAPCVELDYRVNGEPRQITAELTAIPSNLGRGQLWYFICPHTSRRCRKLYLVDGYFYHRSAFRGVFYKQQTLSEKSRDLYIFFRDTWLAENGCDQVYEKHFRKSYKGKMTKRYRRVLRQIKRGEDLNKEVLCM